MSAVERRRSARFPLFEEEAAVIHSGDRDIPVIVVDLSSTGALFSLLDMPALGDRNIVVNQWLELSMHHDASVFQVTARVVRTTRQSIAVEFLLKSDGVPERLAEKLRLLAARKTSQENQ